MSPSNAVNRPYTPSRPSSDGFSTDEATELNRRYPNEHTEISTPTPIRVYSQSYRGKRQITDITNKLPSPHASKRRAYPAGSPQDTPRTQQRPHPYHDRTQTRYDTHRNREEPRWTDMEELEYVSEPTTFTGTKSAFTGQTIQQLNASLQANLSDLATILDHFPTKYTFDPLTKSAGKELFRRLTGEDIHVVTDNANKNNDTIRQSLDNVIQAINSLERKVETNQKTLSDHAERNKLQQAKQQSNPKAAQNTQHRTPTNPAAAHHPSRLIVQMPPDRVTPEFRPDAIDLVKNINSELAKHEDSKHLRVVSVKWNSSGNCIVCTKSDQKAAELAKYQDRFIHLFDTGPGTIVREDKRWFKILVNGVRTGMLDPLPGLYSPETIHAELCANNPDYANLNIIAPPRWMRTKEELRFQAHSSIMFATDDEEKANRLLKEVRTLAVFGRNAFLRKYSDRPPVVQCKKCWAFGHYATVCSKTEPRCRLCGNKHDESTHGENCTQCRAIRESEGMDTDEQIACSHDLRCVNCKDQQDNKHAADARRCPERIRIYGSAQANEKAKQTGQRQNEEGEWTTVRNRGPKANQQRPNTAEPKRTQNRYEILPNQEIPSEDRIAAAAPDGIPRSKITEAMGYVSQRLQETNTEDPTRMVTEC
jgi:phage baseplate assembly protein W